MKHTSEITLYSGTGPDISLVVPRLRHFLAARKKADHRRRLGLVPKKSVPANRRRTFMLEMSLKTLVFDLCVIAAILAAVFYGCSRFL